MNRFERLFFILERNPEDAWLGNKDVRGMVKIILTADQMRVIWELNGLPTQAECQYTLGVFLKKAGDNRLVPKYFSLQLNPHGNARAEKTFSYPLQEGETVFGVGLSVLLKNAGGQRRFPLIAFQNMRAPWRNMLQEVVQSEKQTAEPQVESPKAESQKMQKNQMTLADRLNGNFTACDPFGTTNPAYRWWRNTDMHRLNQSLAEMQLTLPLELNKEGYLACSLFGHVLLGLYSDGTLHREFFILGIPAKDKSGSGNYYANSRWEAIGTQTLPEQEETGYWLTYMDCNSGKVVKVV